MVAFGHGPRRGSVAVSVTLDAGPYTARVTVTGTVSRGLLDLDTRAVRDIGGLGDPRPAVDAWVREFNAGLAHDGRQLRRLRVRHGRLVATKTPGGSAVRRRYSPRRRTATGLAAASVSVSSV